MAAKDEDDRMIRRRDFVGYGDDGPDISWPPGGRMAVSIALNYEEGSEASTLDGDSVGEMASEGAYPLIPGERNVTTESVYEYGSRVGVWRIFHLFREYEVDYTVLGCGQALERNSNVAKWLRSNEVDIVGHGYRWLSHYGMTYDEIVSDLVTTRESIEQTTGRTIHGWMTKAPQAVGTRAALAHQGFLYDTGEFNDDTPYFDEVDGRPFLVVPYSLTANDFSFWQSHGALSPETFAQYCIDEFETLYRESHSRTRMMSLGLHTRIIGRPGRITALARFLDHVRRYDDVWVTNRTEIARFWTEQFGNSDQWNRHEATTRGSDEQR